MTPEQAREFVANNHRAVMITRRSAGGLQTSPVTVGINSNGEVVISSRETAYKVRNLRRHPTATLCVFTDNFSAPGSRSTAPSDRALAASHGRADRLLPPHLRRAPRLGRLPAGHGRPAACAHPADHRRRRPHPRRVAERHAPATWKQRTGSRTPHPKSTAGSVRSERPRGCEADSRTPPRGHPGRRYRSLITTAETRASLAELRRFRPAPQQRPSGR